MATKTADLEKYLKQVRLKELLQELGASDPEALAKIAEHFTLKEAEKRDRIALGYFGEQGVNRIVDTISGLLLRRPKLQENAKILDIGAGTGFFTIKIRDKIRAELPKASFYAMDLTPAMLLSLAKKDKEITPFVGIAENIEGSIEEARKWVHLPSRFDAVLSTLMLHHSVDPERVFRSLRSVLTDGGRAVVADLCEHEFEEFRTEMGDVYLGFKPELVEKMAQKHFRAVKVKKIPGIKCESSGRAAEIFVAFVQK